MAEGKHFYIKSELAERWNVPRQTVNNWTVRRKDFPKPHHILGASDKKMPVFHIDDIKAYEEKHNIKITGGDES